MSSRFFPTENAISSLNASWERSLGGLGCLEGLCSDHPWASIRGHPPMVPWQSLPSAPRELVLPCYQQRYPPAVMQETHSQEEVAQTNEALAHLTALLMDLESSNGNSFRDDEPCFASLDCSLLVDHMIDPFDLPRSWHLSNEPQTAAQLTLIVSVPTTTTRQNLLDAFQVFGPVVIPTVVCKKETRHPKKEWTATAGYAFVLFGSQRSARMSLAATQMGLVLIQGVVVKATWARKDSFRTKVYSNKASAATSLSAGSQFGHPSLYGCYDGENRTEHFFFPSEALNERWNSK